METATYQHSQLANPLLNRPKRNSVYLREVNTFLSSQIKFENLKSSLPLKRFIVCLSIPEIQGN